MDTGPARAPQAPPWWGARDGPGTPDGANRTGTNTARPTVVPGPVLAQQILQCRGAKHQHSTPDNGNGPSFNTTRLAMALGHASSITRPTSAADYRPAHSNRPCRQARHKHSIPDLGGRPGNSTARPTMRQAKRQHSTPDHGAGPHTNHHAQPPRRAIDQHDTSRHSGGPTRGTTSRPTRRAGHQHRSRCKAAGRAPAKCIHQGDKPKTSAGTSTTQTMAKRSTKGGAHIRRSAEPPVHPDPTATYTTEIQPKP